MKGRIGHVALFLVASYQLFLGIRLLTYPENQEIGKQALVISLTLALMCVSYFTLKRIGLISTTDGSNSLYLNKSQMEWLLRQIEKFRMQAKSPTVAAYYEMLLNDLRADRLNLSQLRLIHRIYNIGVKQITGRIVTYMKRGEKKRAKDLVKLQKLLIRAEERTGAFLLENEAQR